MAHQASQRPPAGADLGAGWVLEADEVLVVSVNYAGRVWRWSTRPYESTTADGEAVVADGGIDDAELTSSLGFLSDTPDLASVSIDLTWDDTGVGELVRLRHDLSSAVAEVAIAVEGTAWDLRQVVLVGQVQLPAYGGPEEPVSLAIEETELEDTAIFPPSTYQIMEQTWPTSGTSERGQVYPTVWGRPGGTGTTYFPGSPAFAVEKSGSAANLLLVCWHDVPTHPVTITAYTAGAVVAIDAGLTLSRDVDGLGQAVTVCDCSGAAAAFKTAESWWVSWTDGPAMWSPMRAGAAAYDAGECLYWLMSRSSRRFDAQRTRIAVEALRGYILGFYLVDWTSPEDVLSEHLLPLLPVSIVTGPNGRYPVVLDLRATRESCQWVLVVEPGIARVSDVEYVRRADEVVDEIIIRGGEDTANDVDSRTEIVLKGLDRKEAATLSTYLSLSQSDYRIRGGSYGLATARLVQSRYPDAPPRVYEHSTAIVWDHATLGAVASWRAHVESRAQRSVSYEVPSSNWRTVQLGDLVELTDTDVGILSEIAIVRALTRSTSGRLILDLLLLDAPEASRSLGATPAGYSDPPYPAPQ